MKRKYVLGEVKYRLNLESESGEDMGQMEIRITQEETLKSLNLSKKVEFSENFLAQVEAYRKEQAPEAAIASIEMVIEMHAEDE